ncbi:MAG TPA: hypothetical protein VFR86_30500 [Burkholderiaceae bacterium]|nr:hypothetical protein [Burkholderiaceae bacterium]
MARWSEWDTPITITLTINRSPCRACTTLLVQAADALQNRFPLVFPKNRFILACLGAYEDRDMVGRTTRNDLRELHDAGWRLCVLQEGAGLSARGRTLLEGIERIAGRGHLRLG